MFTVAKATSSCRRQILKLHEFKYSNLQNVCNRNYGSHSPVWSLQLKYFLIVSNNKSRPYSSDSPTAPTSPPGSTTGNRKSTNTIKFTPPPPPKTKLEKERRYVDKVRPPHWHDDEKEKPGITEHMLVEAKRSKHGVAMTFQEKMKEDTKTAWYAGVMIIGVLITITLVYTVWDELFSSDSPNNVYSHAHKLCNANSEVVDTLGYPVRCHGEETRRGWRRHILHQEFWEKGVKVMRMKFYLKGKFRSATVNLQKKANEKGRYTTYDYLIVDVDGYPPKRIIVDVADA